MGQSEWVQAAIRNQLDQTIVLANCSLSWGKYYDISEYLPCVPLLFIDKVLAQITLTKRFRAPKELKFRASLSSHLVPAVARTHLAALRALSNCR